MWTNGGASKPCPRGNPHAATRGGGHVHRYRHCTSHHRSDPHPDLTPSRVRGGSRRTPSALAGKGALSDLAAQRSPEKAPTPLRQGADAAMLVLYIGSRQRTWEMDADGAQERGRNERSPARPASGQLP